MNRPAFLILLGLLAGCDKQQPTTPEKPAGETPASEKPVGEKPQLPVSPAVVQRGVEPLAEHGPLVAVTSSAILLEGTVVVQISGGEVPASEKEGGARGMTIPKLAQAVEARRTEAPVAVLMDPAGRSDVLFSVILSARRAGARSFRLVVAGPDGTIGALPIELPDAKPSSGLAGEIDRVKKGAPAPAEPPPQPVVSATRDKVILWSINGVEGSLAAPRLEIADAGGSADLAPLTASLAEMVQRRWPDPKARPADSRSIIIQIDPAARFQRVAELIAAVRTQQDGSPLYPDVLLGMGFD